MSDLSPKLYEMTAEQLAKLLDAAKPVRAMYLSGGHLMGGSPQENANAAWQRLGDELGFDYMTVRPAAGGQRFFTAIPNKVACSRCGQMLGSADEAEGCRDPSCPLQAPDALVGD